MNQDTKNIQLFLWINLLLFVEIGPCNPSDAAKWQTLLQGEKVNLQEWLIFTIENLFRKLGDVI